MHQYLLLLHAHPADDVDLSPAQFAEMVGRYQAWAGDLAQRGLLVAGEKLTDDGGRHLKLAAGKPVASDGPYAEAHDIIGGLYIIKAEDDAAAQAMAATCPHLVGRQWIEIRRCEKLR
jgi:hypothetical protein